MIPVLSSDPSCFPYLQIREPLYGEGLLSTLEKAIKKDAGLTVAPVLFIGGSDDQTRGLVSELFDFVRDHPRQAEVCKAYPLAG